MSTGSAPCSSSSWKQGASWKMVSASGTVSDSGEILEAEKPSRLVIKWRNEFRPELKAEGYSRCTFEIEASGAATKLTVRHEIDATTSKFIEAVSGGWPRILRTSRACSRPAGWSKPPRRHRRRRSFRSASNKRRRMEGKAASYNAAVQHALNTKVSSWAGLSRPPMNATVWLASLARATIRCLCFAMAARGGHTNSCVYGWRSQGRP